MCSMVSFLGYFFLFVLSFFITYLFILDGCLFSNQKKKRVWVWMGWEDLGEAG